MENGGNNNNNNNNNNNKYWRGQTSNSNSNVWWDLVHLGLGGEEEEEMGISRPYDYWTSNNNVVMINSHDDHHHQHHQEEEEEEEEVMLINPAINITNGIAKKQYHSSSSSSSLYAGSSHVYPDPHLTCLKLGNTNNNNKRRQRQYYFEDGTSNTTTSTAALGKKGKCCYNGDGVPLLSFGFGGGSLSSSTVLIPRCQVDGCHVELLCAREYHRRHKVCEVHSKAKKVEVLGIEQRFCQQCSRFHVITEFDDSKRSCRRRLAGHNERRRKMSSNSSSSSSNDSNTTTTTIISTSRKCFDQGRGGGLPHPKIPSPPRVSNAHSLLSTSGVSPAANLIPRKYNTDVALQDLIAENRANIMASQLFLNNQLARTLNTKNAS